MVQNRGGEVGPVSFTIQPGSPLKFLKMDGQPNTLGPPQSRYKMHMQIAIPSLAAKSCVGVLVHAPTNSAYTDQPPQTKEGIAVWMETDGAGHKRYHVGGRDLLSTHVESRSYPTWDASIADGLPNQDGNEPWFMESWEICMEGQRGVASVCDGRVKLRFRAGPTAGHICFFNGAMDDGAQVHFGNIGLREMGTATVPRLAKSQTTKPGQPAKPGMQRSHSASNIGSRKEKPAKAQSLASGSVLDSMALHECSRLMKYASSRPARVFVPALKVLQAEKKKVLKGSRRPAPTPWLISNWYQDFKPFNALQQQRKAAENKQPLKLGKLKRRKKKTEEDNEVVEESSDSDDDPDSPERRLGKRQCQELRDLFDKFDKYENGWSDTTDLPKILMTFLGYRHPPTEITADAVALVTTYTAVEFNDFLKVFCHFCDLEEERMKRSMADEYGEDAEIGVDEIRHLMKKEGENIFPWAIAETIGGLEEKVDSDGFVLAFRDLRLHCGFTREERDEMEEVFEKFDQDGSGCVSSEEMRRVLKYMGFHPSDDMFGNLIKAVDTDGSGEIDAGEFLTAMRIYNEMQTDQFKAVFDTFDSDGSGEMDTSEVFQCVKTLGWFPTKESIDEAVEMVDKDGTGDISFDEFFKLMQHLRKTEGFTKDEIATFTNLFNKFDVDGSGEISTLELSQILRNLGYPTSVDVLQGLVTEVDVDGSGEIDIGELLKLLRKYRNREMMQSQYAFDKHCVEDEESNKTIAQDKVSEILLEFGWEPSDAMLEKALALTLGMPMGWDTFLNFIKEYRALELEEFNARAGFSEGEVEFYHETFNTYDKDGGGDLSLKELMPLLTELGKEPKTVIQREKLKVILAEVDEDGSGEIGFPEFLQLMRKFLDESDKEQLLKEKEAVVRTNFQPEEVALWRDIFIKFDEDKSGEFDITEGKSLLQAVGINLNERAMHDRYLQLFKEVDEDGNGAMDFAEFLLLMRKLVDIDFGGIATRMQADSKTDDKKKGKKK
jgi:Ca2+-binding EF-hand superfamily protein